MDHDLEQDPDFQALVKCVSFPPLDAIVALAKKRGVVESRYLWELHDYVGRKWRERKSCEGTGDWM